MGLEWYLWLPEWAEVQVLVQLPIIAKLAKELGILTVGIVTTPFNFEGPKRFTQGFEGIEDLRQNVDTLNCYF